MIGSQRNNLGKMILSSLLFILIILLVTPPFTSLSVPLPPLAPSVTSISNYPSATSVSRRIPSVMMPIGVPKVSMKGHPSDTHPQWTDMYNRMSLSRYLFISQPISPSISNQLIASLLSLSSSSPSLPITLFLNSPGGDLSSALALIDAMKHVSCPVSTVASGMCGSAVSLVLCSGTPGFRLALPSARVMLTQLGGGVRGQCEDIRRAARRVMERAEAVADLYAKATGRERGEIRELVGGRERWMGAEEAMRWNLIDGILTEKGGTIGKGAGVKALSLEAPFLN